MGGIIECLYKLVTDKVLFMCCLLLSRMLCSELINKKKCMRAIVIRYSLVMLKVMDKC